MLLKRQASVSSSSPIVPTTPSLHKKNGVALEARKKKTQAPPKKKKAVGNGIVPFFMACSFTIWIGGTILMYQVFTEQQAKIAQLENYASACSVGWPTAQMDAQPEPIISSTPDNIRLNRSSLFAQLFSE